MKIFSMRALALAGSLLLSATGLSFAQQNAATPVMPSHLAIAAEVLKASGLMRTFEASMPNVVDMLRTQVTRQRPELVKDIEEALKLVEARMPAVTNEGVTNAARFMAARLTEAELKEVNTFLNSPVGKKYVENLPGFMQDMLPFLEQWQQGVGQQLMGVFRDEMNKRGHRF
ncbi:MAG: DUF2059 domain-containing protein [Rhabdaerophilum sp.]